MKKTSVLVLSLILLMTFVACGDNNSNNNPVQNTNNSDSYSAESVISTYDNLKDVFSSLSTAEQYADRVAALILRNWTTDYYLIYLYDESNFKMSGFVDEEDFSNVHKYRGLVEDALSEAKAEINSNGNGNLHEAVKEYYLALNNYLTLLSEYPTGYSKLTYSTAISDCQNDCRSARSNAEFYID